MAGGCPAQVSRSLPPLAAEEGCAVFVDVRNRRVVMKMSAKEYSLLAGNLRKRVKNVK